MKTDFRRGLPPGEREVEEVVDESRDDESENLNPCLDCLENVSQSEPELEDAWMS